MQNPYDEIIPGGQTSAPPTEGNPYDEIISQATENTASTVQNNLYRAQDTDPDVYAKALQMGQSIGLHPDTVADQLPDLEKQKQLATQQEQAARESSLTQFLTNDINAKIAKDDLDKLGTVSGMIKAMQGGWDQASLEYELGWIKTREQMHMPGGGDEQRRAEIEGQLQGMPQYPGVAGYLQKATAFGRGLEKSAEVAVPPAAGAALIGAAATPELGGAGAVPAFAGMFTSALAADFARDAAARTYDATGKLKTDTGDPISEPVRQLSAAVAGVGTYFLGKVGGTEVTDATRAGVQSLFTRTLEEAVTRPTVARAMAQFATNMGEAGLKGAALNAMMTSAGTIGEQTARMLTPNMATILSDPAQQEQFKSSLVNSIVDGLTLFPLMELPGAAMGFMGDTLRARQASIDVQNLTDLANGIGESKTRGRDQGTFTDFMRSQVDGTPLEHMAINGDALMSLYQKSGVDPFSLDPQNDPLLGWLPDRDQQLREATACKGDVIVPTSEFLSRMAGTPAFNELLPDIRVRPDGFTMREAGDPEVIHARLTNFANQVRTFQANWAEQAAQQEPSQRVFNDVYDQLRAVDSPANVAAAEAAVMAARYETRAARNGGTYADAWDAYQKSGLKIQQGEDGGSLYQRTSVKPWPEDFPNATIHTTIGKLREHPDHAAAKAGDTEAAMRLVADLVKPERIAELGKQHPDATIVPIHAVEESGKNKIPRMYAQAISDLTGMPVEEGIGQNNVSGHTKKDTFERLLSRANFTGEVKSGQKYVIVDDAISSGGTLSELRHYIENNGGEVVAVTGLTAGKDATHIQIRPETVSAIEGKFGREQTEKLLRDYDIAGRLEALTDREGRHILSYPKLDALRVRIADAGYEEGRSASQGQILPGEREGKDQTQSGLEQTQGPRSIPTSEALAEKPIPLKDITEYDDLEKEAARRAWAEVEKEHGKQVRISEQQLRDQGETLHSELPSTQVLDTIRKTGLKRSSLDDFDQDTVTQLVRKYPGLIRRDGTALLDELAHDHGYESEDALVQDLLSAEKKSDFLDRYAEDAKRDWGLQLGLSPEEWQKRLLDKEREVFAELTRSAPTARMEAIRKRMERNPRAALQLPAEGYGTGPHILNLFAARDRSSFLHEGSHLFLEELMHDASLPDAPDQVKADLQAVKDWFATHAATANGQILAAKRKAESDLALHPEDPQLQARAEVFRKADALLAADPEYMQKFAQTLGADLDPQLRTALLTPFHELFARHAEGYFMEGKAPSPGLQGAFDSFRTWLKNIYQRVAGKGRQLLGLSQAAGFGVDVSPEVRGVMDRLLATDDQIELVRQKQRLGRMFDSAQKAGFTTAEFAHYNDLVAKARTEARNRVQSEALQELEKQKSEAWEAKDAEIRPGIEAQVNSRRDLQALHYLRTGKQLGEEGEAGAKVALSKDALVRLVGEKALRDLPHGLYRIEGGADPQEVGEMFGYRSGTDLARDLLSLEAQRRDLRTRGITDDLRQHVIDQAVHAKLQEHFGDMMVDGTMPGKAMDAVHNDYSNQALAMELRGLIRQAGMTRPLYGPAYDAKGWAQNEIGNHRVSDVLNLSRFARDEARAAEAADRAMLKGDLATAIQQKQAQILNHALYTEAAKAKDNLEKLTTAAARYAKKRTLKGMDQGALDQIHNLLERFGLKNPTPDAANRDTLSNWVQQVRGAYGDVAVSDSLFEQTLPSTYKDLTVSQMRDLQSAVQSISYVGRQLNKITVAGKKVEFEAARDDLVRSAFANTKAVKDLPLERNPGIVQGNFGEKLKARWINAKGALRGLDSSLLKVEQICDWLDGKDSNGAWNSTVFRRAAEREAWENTWRKTMADGIRGLQDLYPADEQKKLSQYLPDIPELKDNQTGAPLRITHSELISMALNWGNASNRGKMLGGEGWRAEAVQGVFDRYMSKADWDFTQGVWDLLEKMRPEISARERRMTGVEPTWIDAVPVDTPHGEYRGGYYPMSYDPARAGDAMDRLIENAERLLDTSRAGRPTTDKGYTMERAEGYSRPVLLSLDVLPRHIDTVVRDLAWREYVFDMVRLFKDPAIRDAMNRTVGSEYQQQLIPWLKGLCSDRTYDPNGLSFWDQVAHRARINTTIVGLGFRASTMLIHGMTAASNSVGELGAKWMGVGASKFFGTPDKMAEARDFVYTRSSEMRTRMDNVDRDIRDGLREMLDKKGVLDPVKRYAYYGVAMLDMASALPTWIGAYERAMHDGMTEPDAIYSADKSVRNAHGGGGAKDMAAVQRGSETQKLFTMFYSFWSHFYNRQRDLGRSGTAAVQDMTSGNFKQGAKDFAAVLARSWWYFVVPQIIHGIIKSGAPGDDESWLGWAAKEVGLGLFSGVPVVRDVANAWGGAHDFKVTPAASIYDAFTSTKKDVGNLISGEKDVSAHWLKHALDTTGYTFGLPTGQAGTALQYLWDVWDGEQNPEDIAEFSKGLVFGTHKKR